MHNSILKNLVSRSIKYEIKRKINLTKYLIKSYAFWKWQNSRFFLNSAQIHYTGNPNNIKQIKGLLGLKEQATADESSKVNIQVNITDFPVPNALSVPATLTTIVKLDRTLEDILASYSRSLRRSIQGQRSEYRYETVTSLEKIREVEALMFKPYADARHENANHMGVEAITSLAKSEYGRLDVLYCGEEAVGCHLGNSYERQGEKYWYINRFGYPAHIFNDFKRWGEVNSMNLHLALENAIQNGYDYCDYGTSLARPGAGLIEWKRRRKGFLAEEYGNYFYVKLPENGARQFLWDSPLFAIADKKITLHLGIPDAKTDEDIMARYHEMGYRGLTKVYLYSKLALNDTLLKSFQDLYLDDDTQPIIINSLVS
jgi:hypothetical protein